MKLKRPSFHLHKIKLHKVDIIFLVLTIFVSLLLLLNPPILSITVHANGVKTYKITLIDVIKPYFGLMTFETRKLVYGGAYNEYYYAFQEASDVFRSKVNDTVFRRFLMKYSAKHDRLQLCIQMKKDEYACQLYVVTPNSIYPVAMIRDDVPTIFFNNPHGIGLVPPSFNIFINSINNSNYIQALDIVVAEYRRDNLFFANTNIVEFLKFWE